MKTYGYWHNQAVDGKSVCNHYAHEIGGECGHPDLGVWTPLVKREPAAEGFDAAVRADAVWMAKLARGADDLACAAAVLAETADRAQRLASLYRTETHQLWAERAARAHAAIVRLQTVSSDQQAQDLIAAARHGSTVALPPPTLEEIRTTG